VREIVFDAFNAYFTVEQLSAENLRIRLSSSEPDDNEQNWNEAAREFHGKALHIKDASDGVQAFVGIVCAVLSGDYRTILIDEPEAFLHPPLARKLGHQLTSNLKAGGTLMASTHSPDFLMGCLQASPNVRVVRLEYSNGKSKGKIVDLPLSRSCSRHLSFGARMSSQHFFTTESSLLSPIMIGPSTRKSITAWPNRKKDIPRYCL
jgi:predicted ATPase